MLRHVALEMVETFSLALDDVPLGSHCSKQVRQAERRVLASHLWQPRRLDIDTIARLALYQTFGCFGL